MTNREKSSFTLLFLRRDGSDGVVAEPIDEKFNKVTERLGGGFMLEAGSKYSAEREVEEKLALSSDFDALTKKTTSYLILIVKHNAEIVHSAHPLDGFCKGEVNEILDEIIETGITLQVRTPLKLENEEELEALKKSGIEIGVHLVVQHRWALLEEPDAGIGPRGSSYPFCSDTCDPDEKLEARIALPDQKEIILTADIGIRYY